VIGAEALSRFPHSDGTSTEAWFMQAASVGMEIELEMLALRTALKVALRLPADIYIAVNLSPGVCLDPRAAETIARGGIQPSRLVLEVTEREEVTDYGQLFSVLAPLRAAGLRVAVDDAGAGFASKRHIIELKPDLIKLAVPSSGILTQRPATAPWVPRWSDSRPRRARSCSPMASRRQPS
jgi:EAL domain-containing protein (putative c-di-GMP-specific phosphodiesterase class I)